jgi:hypothetical protein
MDRLRRHRREPSLPNNNDQGITTIPPSRSNRTSLSHEHDAVAPKASPPKAIQKRTPPAAPRYRHSSKRSRTMPSSTEALPTPEATPSALIDSAEPSQQDSFMEDTSPGAAPSLPAFLDKSDNGLSFQHLLLYPPAC